MSFESACRASAAIAGRSARDWGMGGRWELGDGRWKFAARSFIVFWFERSREGGTKTVPASFLFFEAKGLFLGDGR